RRGAPARVPGPRDPGARAEAHAVDGGRRRDTLGRADPEPGVTRVYLSLGSNAGDRLATLKSAIRRLHGIETVRFLDASPLYDAEPWEIDPGQTVSAQRWFLNDGVTIETSLAPRALLAELHAIEPSLGRMRPPATPEAHPIPARPLDLDT